MRPHVIGIRFHRVGKVYHFDASKYPEIAAGDFAVVETSRGRQLGEVVQLMDDPKSPIEGRWKRILRKATPRDLVLRQYWQRKEIEATINCRAKIGELNLECVKIISAEFSFDGKRLSFLYCTETGAKIDIRALRNKIRHTYPRVRVEMRQVGPRDVAKILGGMGACGMEKRCCSMFITEFSPISIKMAKEQGISLSPSEITGMCGRLRCCLIFEFEQYTKAREHLPKRGKRVITPNGEGKVIDIYPLKGAVLVGLDDGGKHQFLRKDLEPWDEAEALRRKSQNSCINGDDGGCNCRNTIDD